jgi:hypothetical protein
MTNKKDAEKRIWDEIEQLRAVVEVARHWRRAFHHGTSEERDLQEQCLLDALDSLDEQQARKDTA